MIPSASATVRLWEALASTRPPVRSAALLVALGDAPTLDEACDAPLVRCAEAALVELRARTGDDTDTVVTCPSCGAMLDVPLDLAGVAAAARQADEVQPELPVRAPTTRDLLVARDADDPAQALRALCVGSPAGDANPAPAANLDAAVEQLCGAAALSVRADCPECSTAIAADVDVVDLLTASVTIEAEAILRAVAEIASVLGWSEGEILELSPVRREHYLALARTLRGRT